MYVCVFMPSLQSVTFCGVINLNMRVERGFILKQSCENPGIALSLIDSLLME